jgi:hypothetical protein
MLPNLASNFQVQVILLPASLVGRTVDMALTLMFISSTFHCPGGHGQGKLKQAAARIKGKRPGLHGTVQFKHLSSSPVDFLVRGESLGSNILRWQQDTKPPADLSSSPSPGNSLLLQRLGFRSFCVLGTSFTHHCISAQIPIM